MTVTGTIAAVPVSITIGQTSIGFGRIDAKGTAQTGTIEANGFEDSGGGARWFTTSSITVTVVSPSNWTGSVCMSQSDQLPQGKLRLSALPAPTDASQAVTRWETAIAPSDGCGTPASWVAAGQTTTGTGTKFEYNLATFVGTGDAPRTFGATIRFSASNTP